MFWNVMPFFCLAVVIHSIRAHAAVESDSVICAKSIIALPSVAKMRRLPFAITSITLTAVTDGGA